MYEELFFKTGGNMADDMYGFFMAAFKHELNKQDMPQTVLAGSVGVTDKHLNAVYKGRVGKNGKPIRAGIKLQEKISDAFGYQLVDFLKLGENICLNTAADSPQPKEIQLAAQDIPGILAKHINPMDVLDSMATTTSAVSALVRQHQKLDERMRYWRSIFEYLPVSAMVIKDGVVISQNTRSRALKVVTGKPFCESCAGGECDNRDICPVNIATVTAAPASGYKIIENELYKLDVEFVRHNDHEYLIVLATVSSGDAVPFNRRGADRRKEKQEGVE